MLIQIVEHIDLNSVYVHLQRKEAGAVNLFVGTVRKQSNGKEVVKLSFETYHSMALKEMEKVAAAAKEKWNLHEVVIMHVEGEKKVGEPVVLIGVSAGHRHDSFPACRYIIDELKKTVPIWKKEFYEDDSIWVNAHP